LVWDYPALEDYLLHVKLKVSKVQHLSGISVDKFRTEHLQRLSGSLQQNDASHH
jgi:hypothetical protein